MCIYEKLIEVAKDGGKFKIDLNSKSLKIGKTDYIKDGEVLVDEDLINEDGSWERVSELYQIFKYSVPHAKEKQSYFKGLSEDELTDGERAFNVSRSMGRAMLEGYILLTNVKGVLRWENDDNWFWQDENDKDLIVLREWF